VPLYVLALTDGPADTAETDGGLLQDIDLNGIHAICERRSTAPPLTDDALRRQHAKVIAISRRVRAVLPARYGALLKRDELLQLVRNNSVAIRRGLDDVRDRVQMTVRVLGSAARQVQAPASGGREYLERRRQESSPVLPPRARAFIDAVGPFVVRQRQECGAPGLTISLYHLVDAQKIADYKAAARATAGTEIIATGPWPPFAFTPQLF
jgi:hypothetical protein